MRKLLALGLAVMLAGACADQPTSPQSAEAPGIAAAAQAKVTVCHIPPGSENGQLISVAESSVPAHLAHGDALAVCLIITEVMYDPSSAQASDSRGEYFELYNPSDEPVDLRSSFAIASSLKITDESSNAADFFKSLDPTNPASYPLTVPPKGFAVIYDDGTGSDVPAVFSIPASAVQATVDDSGIGNGLNNGGDVLSLLTPDLSVVIDQVGWDGSLADGNGLSLQRCGPGEFVEGDPTPGAANDCG